MLLSDVTIVLSRPSVAGNVGAVCRAMKNMGLSRLRLVEPAFPVDDTAAVHAADGSGACDAAGGRARAPAGGDDEIPPAGTEFRHSGNLSVLRARAVHAADVFENAETFGSLAEAVNGCSLVVGTTRRRGRHRKQATMTPAELAAFLGGRSGTAALVFGNERTGLEDSELELCNIASHIPAEDIFPSLNLSHAVMVYAYELYQQLSKPTDEAVKGQWVPMDQEKINTLVYNLTDKLKAIGFYKQPGREEQERFLRDLAARAGMTEREGEYFVNLIVRAQKLQQGAGHH